MSELEDLEFRRLMRHADVMTYGMVATLIAGLAWVVLA